MAGHYINVHPDCGWPLSNARCRQARWVAVRLGTTVLAEMSIKVGQVQVLTVHSLIERGASRSLRRGLPHPESRPPISEGADPGPR
jgi:hypothetical protein